VLASSGYGDTFFALSPAVAALTLVGFAVAFAGVTATLLARRSRLAEL
jgi:hypothetical protein